MQTENLKTSPEIVLWKKLGITNCTMEFSCGGDSMNDYNFTFYKKNNKKGKNQPEVTEIECEELKHFFDNEVFNRVEFYVNSDGHYQGESGSVEITLDEDSEDEEEHQYLYIQNAQSEWSEQVTEVIQIDLTTDMVNFINENISNINGGDGDITINYKRDVILGDSEEELVDNLENLIKDKAESFEPQDVEGELDDYYTFTTNDGSELEILTIEENKLSLIVNKSTIVYRDSED
jgi:hypothetical protein